jgi:hypothetical protein
MSLNIEVSSFPPPQAQQLRVLHDLADEAGGYILGKGAAHFPFFAFLENKAVTDNPAVVHRQGRGGEERDKPNSVNCKEVVGNPKECPQKHQDDGRGPDGERIVRGPRKGTISLAVGETCGKGTQGSGVIWKWQGRPARERSRPREGVKISRKARFFACKLLKLGGRKNEILIFSHLQMAVPQQMTTPPEPRKTVSGQALSDGERRRDSKPGVSCRQMVVRAPVILLSSGIPI